MYRYFAISANMLQVNGAFVCLVIGVHFVPLVKLNFSSFDVSLLYNVLVCLVSVMKLRIYENRPAYKISIFIREHFVTIRFALPDLTSQVLEIVSTEVQHEAPM